MILCLGSNRTLHILWHTKVLCMHVLPHGMKMMISCQLHEAGILICRPRCTVFIAIMPLCFDTDNVLLGLVSWSAAPGELIRTGCIKDPRSQPAHRLARG